jgi:hypothetical protein
MGPRHMFADQGPGLSLVQDARGDRRAPLCAVGRLYTDLTIIEVPLQQIDRARVSRQGHIGVRPNQIGGVLGEAGISVLLPPCKHMER